MPLDFVRGWVEDRAVENRVEDVRKPGEYNADWLDSLVGKVVGADTEGAVDTYTSEVKEYENKTKWKPQLEAEGLKWREGMTPGEALRAITEKRDATNDEKVKKTQNLQFDSPQAREERRLAAQTRADLLRSQDRTLQFQMLQAQRENDRYYDRLDREDARLRREGYQSLGTGLAALAAAFTIV